MSWSVLDVLGCPGMSLRMSLDILVHPDLSCLVLGCPGMSWDILGCPGKSRMSWTGQHRTGGDRRGQDMGQVYLKYILEYTLNIHQSIYRVSRLYMSIYKAHLALWLLRDVVVPHTIRLIPPIRSNNDSFVYHAGFGHHACVGNLRYGTTSCSVDTSIHDLCPWTMIHLAWALLMARYSCQ